MDFHRTDEQSLLLESVDEFFAQNPQFDEHYIRDCEQQQVPLTEFRRAFVEAGFGMLGIPEEFGGTPVDTQTLVMMAEKVYEYGYPSGMGTLLQVDDILTYGSEAQQREIMDTMQSSGGSHMAFCLGLSEPQAGSDSSGITTSYERKDGKVVINGHKTFATDGDRAKYMLCMTRDFNCDLPAGKAMTTWLVPMDAPGVKMENWHKVGHRTRSLCEVYLDNVVVDETDMVGPEHEGFLVVMKNFEAERLVLAAEALGMASCCYNDALLYASEREQFGKKIGDYQLIQELLVEMRVKVDNMRNSIYKTAWEKDNGMPLKISAALCKYYVARASFEVCDAAMQVLGGIGYTDESRVSRLWRDSRMYRIGGGTDQIMIHIAGRALVKEAKRAQ
jgi:alkylation response protein AidB-like acyl-CoA dehydrogenase